MKESNNIEELFKSKLSSFEAPVNDAMWANISSNIVAPAASGATSSVFSKLFSTAGIAVTTGVVCTVATFFIMSAGQENEKAEQKSILTAEKEEILTETKHKIDVVNDDELAVSNIVNPPTNESNDPVIKVIKEKPSEEKYKIVPTKGVEEHNDYKKEPSAISSFLTPKSKIRAENEQNTANSKDNTIKEEENELTIIEAEENELIANIIASPVGGYAPLDVYFSNTSGAERVHWNFGDGSESDETSPSHTFEKYGTYTVELTVTGKDGAIEKDHRIIEVIANSAITDVPNVFTPNGDGINDFYVVKGKNLGLYQFKVFNRSGEVIYSSNSIDSTWDGKDKYENDLPEGVYFFLITAKGIDGKVYEHTGTITLSR